ALLCSFDEAYGWRELAAGGVTVRVFPGAHEDILDEPHAPSVAEALKAMFMCSFAVCRGGFGGLPFLCLVA
ncbi:hypothetical protein HYY27_11075, partial [bacterium]|nr:hypothetical protein [bacterium]